MTWKSVQNTPVILFSSLFFNKSTETHPLVHHHLAPAGCSLMRMAPRARRPVSAPLPPHLEEVSAACLAAANMHIWPHTSDFVLPSLSFLAHQHTFLPAQSINAQDTRRRLGAREGYKMAWALPPGEQPLTRKGWWRMREVMRMMIRMRWRRSCWTSRWRVGDFVSISCDFVLQSTATTGKAPRFASPAPALLSLHCGMLPIAAWPCHPICFQFWRTRS